MHQLMIMCGYHDTIFMDPCLSQLWFLVVLLILRCNQNLQFFSCRWIYWGSLLMRASCSVLLLLGKQDCNNILRETGDQIWKRLWYIAPLMSELIIWNCFLDGFLVVRSEFYSEFYLCFISVDIFLSRNLKYGLNLPLVRVFIIFSNDVLITMSYFQWFFKDRISVFVVAYGDVSVSCSW